MLSLFRQAGRQKGPKQRRSRRKRRVAKIVAPAVITAALLIPIISTLTGDPATSDTTSTCSTSSSSSDSGTTISLATAGGTAGSGSGSGTDSTSGTSSTSPTASTSDSSGSSTAETAITAGTASGVGSTSGDLSGLVLAFEEDPASGTESGSAITVTSPGTEVTGTGSAFDEYPPVDLIAVEEDWELTITQPDPALGAPQIGTVMTPFEDSGDFYLAFVVNHRFNPAYSVGGMELQLWYQGEQLGWLTFGEGLLSLPNETIRWTQRLELKQEKLRFSVVQGTSSTWGDFGAGESMHLELTTTLTDLNDYHPGVSARNSGVVFASNRVGSLSLKKVRGYDKNGALVLQDNDPVIVFALGQ